MDIQLFQYHLLEKVHFLHWIAIAPLSKINWLHICAYIFWLYSVPLINDSIVSPVQLYSDYCGFIISQNQVLSFF